MITAPARFKNSPVFAIWKTVILFVPKTMAFGGVATGSMKAMDAEMVAGSIKRRGLIFVLIAIPARIGSIISVVAVLDVSSVRNVISRAMDKITRMGL